MIFRTCAKVNFALLKKEKMCNILRSRCYFALGLLPKMKACRPTSWSSDYRMKVINEVKDAHFFSFSFQNDLSNKEKYNLLLTLRPDGSFVRAGIWKRDLISKEVPKGEWNAMQLSWVIFRCHIALLQGSLHFFSFCKLFCPPIWLGTLGHKSSRTK